MDRRQEVKRWEVRNPDTSEKRNVTVEEYEKLKLKEQGFTVCPPDMPLKDNA